VLVEAALFIVLDVGVIFKALKVQQVAVHGLPDNLFRILSKSRGTEH
jgi:hypothetical protein